MKIINFGFSKYELQDLTIDNLIHIYKALDMFAATVGETDEEKELRIQIKNYIESGKDEQEKII